MNHNVKNSFSITLYQAFQNAINSIIIRVTGYMIIIINILLIFSFIIKMVSVGFSSGISGSVIFLIDIVNFSLKNYSGISVFFFSVFFEYFSITFFLFSLCILIFFIHLITGILGTFLLSNKVSVNYFIKNKNKNFNLVGYLFCIIFFMMYLYVISKIDVYVFIIYIKKIECSLLL